METGEMCCLDLFKICSKPFSSIKQESCVLEMSIKSVVPVTPSSVSSQMAHYPKHGSFGTLIPNRIFVGGIASDVR